MKTWWYWRLLCWGRAMWCTLAILSFANLLCSSHSLLVMLWNWIQSKVWSKLWKLPCWLCSLSMRRTWSDRSVHDSLQTSGIFCFAHCAQEPKGPSKGICPWVKTLMPSLLCSLVQSQPRCRHQPHLKEQRNKRESLRCSFSWWLCLLLELNACSHPPNRSLWHFSTLHWHFKVSRQMKLVFQGGWNCLDFLCAVC